MSYSTLILSLLLSVLSSIPPSFCVYDDGCFRDQTPCTQGSLFPYAQDASDCAVGVVMYKNLCTWCLLGCDSACTNCIKFMVYNSIRACCPNGYCIPSGMDCFGNSEMIISCCTDNGMPVQCSNDGVCCNPQGAKCTNNDACCGIYNCGYDMATGNNICQFCYASGEPCSITDHIECCGRESHCVNQMCQSCSLTGEDCTSAGDCCYDDDKCITGKCCKSTTDEKCIVCASYLEVCNDGRSDFDIPCCYDMRCAPNGYCYCGTGDASCTSDKTCCDGYYCDPKSNTCQYI